MVEEKKVEKKEMPIVVATMPKRQMARRRGKSEFRKRYREREYQGVSLEKKS